MGHSQCCGFDVLVGAPDRKRRQVQNGFLARPVGYDAPQHPCRLSLVGQTLAIRGDAPPPSLLSCCLPHPSSLYSSAPLIFRQETLWSWLPMRAGGTAAPSLSLPVVGKCADQAC